MADASALLHHAPATSDGALVRLWPWADPATFKDSLARLASGVAVAACWTPKGPRGLLISSITGLSAEPPRMLFCVRKATSSHGALLGADAVGLSVLAADQQAEAERFSRQDLTHERFGAAWSLDPAAPPVLPRSLATLSGPIRSRIDAGSHTVFILDVSIVTTRSGPPLVYFERDYAAGAAGRELR